MESYGSVQDLIKLFSSESVQENDGYQNVPRQRRSYTDGMSPQLETPLKSLYQITYAAKYSSISGNHGNSNHVGTSASSVSPDSAGHKPIIKNPASHKSNGRIMCNESTNKYLSRKQVIRQDIIPNIKPFHQPIRAADQRQSYDRDQPVNAIPSQYKYKERVVVPERNSGSDTRPRQGRCNEQRNSGKSNGTGSADAVPSASVVSKSSQSAGGDPTAGHVSGIMKRAESLNNVSTVSKSQTNGKTATAPKWTVRDEVNPGRQYRSWYAQPSIKRAHSMQSVLTQPRSTKTKPSSASPTSEVVQHQDASRQMSENDSPHQNETSDPPEVHAIIKRMELDTRCGTDQGHKVTRTSTVTCVMTSEPIKSSALAFCSVPSDDVGQMQSKPVKHPQFVKSFSNSVQDSKEKMKSSLKLKNMCIISVNQSVTISQSPNINEEQQNSHNKNCDLLPKKRPDSVNLIPKHSSALPEHSLSVNAMLFSSTPDLCTGHRASSQPKRSDLSIQTRNSAASCSNQSHHNSRQSGGDFDVVDCENALPEAGRSSVPETGVDQLNKGHMKRSAVSYSIVNSKQQKRSDAPTPGSVPFIVDGHI